MCMLNAFEKLRNLCNMLFSKVCILDCLMLLAVPCIEEPRAPKSNGKKPEHPEATREQPLRPGATKYLMAGRALVRRVEEGSVFMMECDDAGW